MGVAAEPWKNRRHLLVDHGVMDHAAVEVFLLRLGWKGCRREEVAVSRKSRFRQVARSDSRGYSRTPGIAIDVDDLDWQLPVEVKPGS